MSGPTLRGRPHRGSVEVEAIVLDLRWLREEDARARALTIHAAHPGAKVHATDGALVVVAAMRLNVREAVGTPLVRQGAALCSVQLTARDRRALSDASIETCWARAGVAQALDLSKTTELDVGAWIDVRTLRIEAGVSSLGAQPAAPADAEPALDPDMRKALQMPPASAEAGAVGAALAAAGRGAEGLGRLVGALAALTSVAAALTGHLVVPLLGFFRSLFGTSADSEGSARRKGGRGGSSSAGLAPLGWLARLERALRNWIARSRLGALLSRQHARYLQRMLEMFEQGRLDEALRHAIPLGGDGLQPPQAALGSLSPRTDLSIDLEPRSGAGTSLFGGADLYELLRRRYRAAFEMLVQRGEVEKAAFVLVELLRQHEEGVSFLERHGRLRLAAELAESKGLAPGLQIRQWFLARDVPRALAIARRTGAFADAVLRLSRDHAPAAEALRIAWAGALAEGGAFGAAVDVLWPLVRCRPIAMAWIEQGIEIGGVTGARMLARKASEVPDAIESVSLGLDRLLLADPEGAARALGAFADHLLVHERGGPTARLARSVWRRGMRLGGATGSALSEAQRRGLYDALRRLLSDANDPLLAHEAQKLPAPSPLQQRSLAERLPPIVLRWGTDDRGALIAEDGLELSDGRILLALGELGALLLRPDGSVQARFAQPADALVASHRGDRAILLAARGRASRLARLDLITRRCEPWCDASITAWAPTFDGDTWYVAHESELFGIDATATSWSHRLHLAHDRTEMQLATLRCDDDELRALFLDPSLDPDWAAGSLELWCYALPAQTLRRRTELPMLEGGEPVPPSFSAGGTLVRTATTENAHELLRRTDRGRDAPGNNVDTPALRVLAAPNEWVREVSETWVVSTRPHEAGVIVAARDVASLTVRLELHLNGADRARVRLLDERLVVLDDVGRVLVVSLTTGAVIRDLRPTG